MTCKSWMCVSTAGSQHSMGSESTPTLCWVSGGQQGDVVIGERGLGRCLSALPAESPQSSTRWRRANAGNQPRWPASGGGEHRGLRLVMNRRSVLRWICTPLPSGIARAERLAAGSMPWMAAGGGNSNTVMHRERVGKGRRARCGALCAGERFSGSTSWWRRGSPPKALAQAPILAPKPLCR